MNSKHLIEIICDGNNQMGFGHIRRSLTLAEQLVNEGMDVRVTGLSAFARSILPAPVHVGLKASIVVYDSFQRVESLIRKSQENGQITVTLDWFGDIDPDVNIAVYPHKEVRAKLAKYIGFEYILVRNDIASLRCEKAIKKSSNVIICIGGGDLLNHSHQAAYKLSAQNVDVTIINGPLTKKPDKKDEYPCLYSPSNFSQLLAECNWAVTNGGGCFFEALCLGKAAFVLPQTQFEMSIAQYASERGALLGIGIDNLRTFSPEEIRNTSELGANLVDGYGAKRISSIIKGLL